MILKAGDSAGQGAGTCPVKSIGIKANKKGYGDKNDKNK